MLHAHALPRPPCSVSATRVAPRTGAGRRRGRALVRAPAAEGNRGDDDDGAAAAPPDPIQARLAAAKAYKQKQQETQRQAQRPEQPPTSSGTSSSYTDAFTRADERSFLQAQTDLNEAKASGLDEGLVEVTIERGFGAADTTSVQNKNAPQPASQSASQSASQPDPETYRASRTSGSSTSAARWLQTTSTQADGISSDLRAEEFTAEKEKRVRGQEIVIERAKGIVEGTRRKQTTMDEYGSAQMFQDAEMSIAADKQAEEKLMAEIAEMAALEEVQRKKDERNAEGGSGSAEGKGGNTHKPAVATWGVFPRPSNISKTYGGGRNIRPGQELETEEEADARQKRVAQALASYRKVVGLDIEPEVEDAAMELYEQGQELFEAGSLRMALEKYELACDMVPLKSKVGGLANFQKAVCLDSLGRNDEAYSIYKSLRGHSAPGVAKNSKRMMFGFQAAKDLKVDKMRAINAGSVDQWRGYFDRATDGTWAVYKRKEGEDEEDDAEEKKLLAVMLGLLVGLPVLTVVGLASAR